MTNPDIQFQCCYCDQSIEHDDDSALRISISALRSNDGSVQELYAHRKCVLESFAPALSRSVQFEAEVFDED